MVKTAAGAVKHTIEGLEQRIKENGLEINMIDEISKLTIKVILTCAVGKDISDQEVDFWEHGRREKRSIAFVLRDTFSKLSHRLQEPHVCFFPSLADWFILPYERDIKRNALTIRARMHALVCERQFQIKQGDFESNDLL